MNQEPPFRTPKGEALVRRPLPDGMKIQHNEVV
jgi:hypothetical protein